MKKSHSFSVVLGGFACAGTLISLYFASFSPSGTLAIVAFSGFFPFLVQSFSTTTGGFLCWGASSVLSFLLIPEKTVVFLFLFCFGLYPMLKIHFEKQKYIFALLLKLLYANSSFFFCFFFLKHLLFPLFPPFLHHYPLLLLGGNLYFLAYDYGLSQIIPVILRRLRFFIPQ